MPRKPLEARLSSPQPPAGDVGNDFDLLDGIELTASAIPDVSDRVRLALLATMLDQGVQGARDLPAESLAKLAHTTPAALTRAFPGGTHDLLNVSIEWAFAQVNRFVMEYGYENPTTAAVQAPTDVATASPTAVASLHGDFIAVLHRMWNDARGRLTATAALLVLRKGSSLGVAPGREQQRFLTRLGTLAAAHLGVAPDSPTATALRDWLATYLASTWFAWLIDSDLVEAPDYVYGIEHVLLGLDRHLTDTYRAAGNA